MVSSVPKNMFTSAEIKKHRDTLDVFTDAAADFLDQVLGDGGIVEARLYQLEEAGEGEGGEGREEDNRDEQTDGNFLGNRQTRSSVVVRDTGTLHYRKSAAPSIAQKAAPLDLIGVRAHTSRA